MKFSELIPASVARRQLPVPVPRATFYRLVAQGELPSYRLFDPAAEPDAEPWRGRLYVPRAAIAEIAKRFAPGPWLTMQNAHRIAQGRLRGLRVSKPGFHRWIETHTRLAKLGGRWFVSWPELDRAIIVERQAQAAIVREARKLARP